MSLCCMRSAKTYPEMELEESKDPAAPYLAGDSVVEDDSAGEEELGAVTQSAPASLGLAPGVQQAIRSSTRHDTNRDVRDSTSLEALVSNSDLQKEVSIVRYHQVNFYLNIVSFCTVILSLAYIVVATTVNEVSCKFTSHF